MQLGGESVVSASAADTMRGWGRPQPAYWRCVVCMSHLGKCVTASGLRARVVLVCSRGACVFA